MKKWLFSFLLLASLAVVIPTGVSAQCAMCKATAESSIKDGNNTAKGLNLGIFYLLVIPYALVGAVGYWWYAKNKKQKEAKEETL